MSQEYTAPNFTNLPNGLTTTLGDELNTRFNALKAGLIGTHNDSAALVSALFGGGKIYSGTDRLEDAPEAGTGLTLHLLNGSYIIQGVLVEVADAAGYIIITGVPSNKTSGVYGYLSLDDNGVPVVLSGDWYVSLPDASNVAGKPCIGLIKTSDDVDEIVYDEYNTIPTYSALAASLSSGSGGGSGGTGDVTQAQLNAVIALVNGLNNRLTILENSIDDDTVVSVQNESEILHAEVLRMMAKMVEMSADTSKRVKASIDMPGVTGDGEMLSATENSPTVYVGGTMTRDSNTRTIK